MGKHWVANEGKGVGKASPAQILEVISGEISVITLMRYKTSDAIKPVIRHLVLAQELENQVGQPGIEKGDGPRWKQPWVQLGKLRGMEPVRIDWPRYLCHGESPKVTWGPIKRPVHG